MKIVWSIPVRGEQLSSARGDLVRSRNLINAIREKHHKVTVVEDSSRLSARVRVATYRQLCKTLLPLRAAYQVRDVGRLFHGILHGLSVANAARRVGADFIIETQVALSPSGTLAARLTGLPLVMDDCSPASEEVLLGVGLPRLVKYTLLWQARVAKRMVVSTQTLSAFLVDEGVPKHKLTVVPNGIDIEKYRLTNGDHSRRELGFSNSCVIGFFGSFQPWHQVELLVQAVARIAEQHDLRLLLVGDGNRRAAALAEADNLGIGHRVKAVGEVPHEKIPELLSAIDIGALPASNSYGQPMKLIEYGAACLPCVAPDIPPVRELIQDRVSGLLFPRGDVDALSSALSELVGDGEYRDRLGHQARVRVERQFSWSKSAEDLLNSVLN